MNTAAIVVALQNKDVIEAIAKAVETHVQAAKETKSQGRKHNTSVIGKTGSSSSTTRIGDGEAPPPPCRRKHENSQSWRL